MKRPIATALLVFTVLIGILSCNGRKDEHAAEPPSNARVIGPTGGTLTFANGVKLVFPAGAVDTDTTITVDDLPAAKAQAVLSNPSLVATRSQRFVGGFSASPDGLAFKAPIEAWIPVQPLTSGETAVLFMLDLKAGTYEYADSTLHYDGKVHVARVTLQHFSNPALGGVKETKPEPGDCTQCEAFASEACKNAFAESGRAYHPCCLLEPPIRAACPAAARCYDGPFFTGCCEDFGQSTVEHSTHFECKRTDLPGEVCVFLGTELETTFEYCGDQGPSTLAPDSTTNCTDLAPEITLHPSPLNLPLGVTSKPPLTVTGIAKRGTETVCQGTPRPLWSSDDPAVLDFVDQAGNLQAKAVSLTPATVRARLGGTSGIEATATVNVFCKNCRIEIEPTTTDLSVGQALELRAHVLDSSGATIEVPAETIEWSTSNPEVADFSQKTGAHAALRALSPGSTRIVAGYKDLVTEAASNALRVDVERDTDAGPDAQTDAGPDAGVCQTTVAASSCAGAGCIPDPFYWICGYNLNCWPALPYVRSCFPTSPYTTSITCCSAP